MLIIDMIGNQKLWWWTVGWNFHNRKDMSRAEPYVTHIHMDTRAEWGAVPILN